MGDAEAIRALLDTEGQFWPGRGLTLSSSAEFRALEQVIGRPVPAPLEILLTEWGYPELGLVNFHSPMMMEELNHPDKDWQPHLPGALYFATDSVRDFLIDTMGFLQGWPGAVYWTYLSAPFADAAIFFAPDFVACLRVMVRETGDWRHGPELEQVAAIHLQHTMEAHPHQWEGPAGVPLEVLGHGFARSAHGALLRVTDGPYFPAGGVQFYPYHRIQAQVTWPEDSQAGGPEAIVIGETSDGKLLGRPVIPGKHLAHLQGMESSSVLAVKQGAPLASARVLGLLHNLVQSWLGLPPLPGQYPRSPTEA